MEESNLVLQLQELARLHVDGALTDEEFALAKERLLRRPETAARLVKRAAPVDDEKPFTDHSPVSSPGGSRTPPPGGSGAALTSLIGSTAALISFFALPVITLPFVGAVTAPSLTALLSSGENGMGYLWLIPLAAAVAVGLGLWLWRGSVITPNARRRTCLAVIAAAVLAIAVYLIWLARIQTAMEQRGSSDHMFDAGFLTGPGFWFVVLGMIVAGMAALVEFNRPATSADDAKEPGVELGEESDAFQPPSRFSGELIAIFAIATILLIILVVAFVRSADSSETQTEEGNPPNSTPAFVPSAALVNPDGRRLYLP